MSKKPTITITDDQVEQELLRLGALERRRVRMKKHLDDQIAAVKETFRLAADPLDDEIHQIHVGLKGYAKKHMRTWEKAGRRSRDFHHGSVGFRRSTRLKVPKNEERLIEQLEAAVMDCVKVYKRPDLEELEKFDDAALARVGVERVTRDNFFAQPSLVTDPGDITEEV